MLFANVLLFRPREEAKRPPVLPDVVKKSKHRTFLTAKMENGTYCAHSSNNRRFSSLKVTVYLDFGKGSKNFVLRLYMKLLTDSDTVLL